MTAAPAERGTPASYTALRIVSLLLILGGIGLIAYVLQSSGALLGDDPLGPGDAGRAAGALVSLLLGGVALTLGLVMHAVRSIVARERLPAHRYRGPSIIVLYLLATVAANLATLPVVAEVGSLLSAGDPSLYGTIVTLTVTQVGLLGAVGLFVMAPRALAGMRLLPPRGLLRSVGIGLLLVVPSWIGAQLIGYATLRLLEPLGIQPESGVAELALSRADPVVVVIALVLVAPVVEEIFFRGVAYNAWEREYGPRRALLGTALLFAVIHGSVFLTPVIFALGMVLGLLYRASRSLPAAIALHAGFNGITVGLSLLVRYGILEIPIT